jgi:hypothetical protein
LPEKFTFDNKSHQTVRRTINSNMFSCCSLVILLADLLLTISAKAARKFGTCNRIAVTLSIRQSYLVSDRVSGDKYFTFF